MLHFKIKPIRERFLFSALYLCVPGHNKHPTPWANSAVVMSWPLRLNPVASVPVPQELLPGEVWPTSNSPGCSLRLKKGGGSGIGWIHGEVRSEVRGNSADNHRRPSMVRLQDNTEEATR